MANVRASFWSLGPKGKRIQTQRVQYNEFVESGLENQALMSQVTIIIDLDDKKVNIDWFYLKKIILGIIQVDQFLYICLEFDYRHNSCCYNVLYYLFFFYLYPPRVDQIAGVDPCPISTFLKSLVVAIGLKITIHVSLPH